MTTPTELTPPGDARALAVREALRSWQRSLVDLGGRNTLLWYRDLPAGTLDLTHAHPGGLSKLLAAAPTRLSELFRERVSLTDARHRARTIAGKSLELKEERGIAAGFLAIGMATWQVPRAPRAPQAPILLRSCTLKPTGAAREDFVVDLGPEIEFNPVLAHYLASERGITVDAEALAEMATVAGRFDPQPVYAALAHECSAITDFVIDRRYVIGTFSYAKLPMVADLAAQGDALANHDVIAALAGDADALSAVRTHLPEPIIDPDPGREHLVLDADSSQQAVIDAVRTGAHLVVKGPPGTGKSQTIANLIAALASDGKRTLFVAEKRAAIDAVLSRLDRVGLSGLVLDVYDGATNRRSIARAFGDRLEELPELARRRDDDRAIQRVRDRRSVLVEHLQALHKARDPWGVSAYEAQVAMTELAARQPAPMSRVRFHGATLAGLSRTRVVELGRGLTDAASLGAWSLDGADPWFGARIVDSDEAARALEIVSALSRGRLEQLTGLLNTVLAESNLPAATTVADWHRALTTMTAVRDTLEVFRPEVFDTPLTEPIAATASRQWRKGKGVEMGYWARRAAKAQARRLLRPGHPPADLHAELVEAARQRQHWQALVGAGARPEITLRINEANEAFAPLWSDLQWLDERVGDTTRGGGLTGIRLGELQHRLDQWADAPERLAVLPTVTTVLDEFREAGLGELLDDLAARSVAPGDVAAELDHVWWGSILQDVTVRDSAYGAHDGRRLRVLAGEYAAADAEHLAAGAARVNSAAADQALRVLADHPDQEALLRAEAGRQRRHKALRDLMPRAAAAMTAVKPCWAMSPLVVASVLPPGEWFDVVIFDEASQIPPAQAISAISRARQVVVAGDERQLPPTQFFTADSGEDEDDDALTAGFESVLDVLAAALPTRRLTWHYRSRDERLIAFANQNMYAGTLITFPGTCTESTVSLELVDGVGRVEPGTSATIESTDAEVNRVVELIIEHATQRPEESLGVITLGLKHAQRIENALHSALLSHRDLDDFFDQDRNERFFIKNLERVQGDERDAVIMSIGYGKTPHGRVLHRFGPLNNEGGERRLNVAMTRAKTRMIVVSSLAAEDLDPARLRARGATMLRDFLAYAAQGGSRPDHRTASTAGSPVGDPLIADLARRLRREGLKVHEGYGNATHRIDVAVEDPFHAGKVLIAVESDGPSYAALTSARDRDRLRVEQLRRLGWKHVRVWSTDMFRDPAQEISRIVGVARQGRTVTGSVVRVTADQTTDDTDEGWGQRPDETARDRWLQEQRPPHYE